MKKRMYRLLSLIVVAAIAFGIAGCSAKPKTEDKKDEISQSVSGEEPEDVSEDVSEEDKESSVDKEASAPEETPDSSSAESNAEVNASATDDEESNAEAESPFPGPDIVELVNLRGDETTAYKLADGRYMDKQDTVYIFDGVDTWTEAGTQIEWNEKVN